MMSTYRFDSQFGFEIVRYIVVSSANNLIPLLYFQAYR